MFTWFAVYFMLMLISNDSALVWFVLFACVVSGFVFAYVGVVVWYNLLLVGC